MRHYFVTGATGVVGSAFLEKISSRGERASLLVRADTELSAQERLKRIIRHCNIPTATADRIRLVRGDLYYPRMGMNTDDYRRLASDCTHVVHCAGNVQMSLPIDEARRQTLAATHNVLDFSESSSVLQKLEFVSTVGVTGRTAGTLDEAWLSHPRQYRNSYEAAKAEAEDIVRKRSASGLPVTVHRPSMVVGNSRTGKTVSFQVFYYLCEFLSGRRSYGILPKIDGMRLDIIPSDYVATLLDASSLDTTGRYPILHSCSGRSGAIELTELVKRVRTLFRQNGRRLPPVCFLPVPLFKLALAIIKPLLPRRQRKAVGALPYFLSYMEEKQDFSNILTKRFIEPKGIDLPEVEGYLDTVIMHYLSTQGQRRKG